MESKDVVLGAPLLSCVILSESFWSPPPVFIYAMMGPQGSLQLSNPLTPRHLRIPMLQFMVQVSWVLLFVWKRVLPCLVYPACFLRNLGKSLS